MAVRGDEPLGIGTAPVTRNSRRGRRTFAKRKRASVERGVAGSLAPAVGSFASPGSVCNVRNATNRPVVEASRLRARGALVEIVEQHLTLLEQQTRFDAEDRERMASALEHDGLV